MQGYMPVFLQTAPQQQPAPQESVLQPAPVDPSVKKIKDAKASVEKYQKRVKCTSITLMLIGVIGMVASVYHSFTAKHHAMMMVNFPKSHHGRHGGPPPPRPEELKDMAPKYVSRDEFEVYDTIKTMTMITFFIFGKILAIGKCGKWMVWRNRSNVTHRLMKKSCCGFVLVLLMSMWAMKEGKHIKMIVKNHQKELSWPPMEDGEIFSVDGHGRKLKEITEEPQTPMVFLGDDEATCNAHADDKSCNADGPCSWCVSSAVKSACHSTVNAKTLPSAVFDCSKVSAPKPAEEKKPVEVKKPVNPLKDDEQFCHATGSEGACNSHADKCSWCKSAAVAASCHSISNAKSLPAAVFDCSNLPTIAEQRTERLEKEMDKVFDEANKQFEKFTKEASKMFDVKDDEDDCNAHGDEGTCNAEADKCSWCKSAAVKSACHSIANAKSLPAAVFQCSNLDSFFYKKEEKSSWIKDLKDGSLWGGFKKGRKHHRRHPRPDDEDDEDDEDEEPRGFFGIRGKKHHRGGRHGHGRRPRVQADHDDEETVIMAGTPVKGSVAKQFNQFEDDEPEQDERPHGFHGRHGHGHGKHGKHGGKRCCKLVKLVMFLVFVAHFSFIKGLKTSQEKYETLTGKKPDDFKWGKCKWGKKDKKEKKVVAEVSQQQVIQQPVYMTQPVIQYSAINSESSIDTEAPEIHEERDKQDMGVAYAPAPVATTITFNNQMI